MGGKSMKRIILVAFLSIVSFAAISISAGQKGLGEKCLSDAECAFQLRCHDGVCIKKSELDFGSSVKTGKPCNNDADCIGSGKCVEGSFGRKYCSGN
jgi:hypothetical protein